MGWWRKGNKKKRTLERGAMLLEDLIKCCDGKSNPIKFFSADEIFKVTKNFSKSNYRSELSYFDCKWYLGSSANHPKILVRKLAALSKMSGKLCRDIAISSMVSGHKNFLKLVGCCLEFEGPVMVYHGVKKHQKLDISEQTWKRRMKIAEDIATALAYLHTAFPRPFIHRSLSLANILLDEDGVAKLRDFSYCVSIPKGKIFVKVDVIAGSYGFMEEKYISSGVVSEETDVFAIGTIMQKLLMGEERYGELKYESSYYGIKRCFQTKLAKFKEDQRMYELADPKMLEKMGEISEQELCQMEAFLILSQRCNGRRGEVPKMVEVAKELKKIQKSLTNDDSSYPFVETQFDSAQDILSYSPERISFRSSPEIVSPR